MCGLELKLLLLPAKKQKKLACTREIQVHKLRTKVYSLKGLTAMGTAASSSWNTYFINRKLYFVPGIDRITHNGTLLGYCSCDSSQTLNDDQFYSQTLNDDQLYWTSHICISFDHDADFQDYSNIGNIFNWQFLCANCSDYIQSLYQCFIQIRKVVYKWLVFFGFTVWAKFKINLLPSFL